MIPELRGISPDKLLYIISSTSSSFLTQSEYVYLTVALNRASKAAKRPPSQDWEKGVGSWLCKHADRMPARQTTLAMNALARVGVDDSSEWTLSTLAALVKRAEQLGGQDLSLALNAIAKVLADENHRPLNGVPPGIIELVGNLVCRVLPRVAGDLTPQGFANILHACAKLKISSSSSAVVTLEKYCINPLLRSAGPGNPASEMNLHELCLLVYALSRLYPPGHDTIRRIFHYAASRLTTNEGLQKMQISQLVMIVHSFDKVNFIPDDETIKRLSYFIAPMVDRMEISELASVAKFFVSSGVPDTSILMEVSRRLRSMPRDKLRSAQNLSLLMGAYAKALVRDSPIVCGVLLANLMRCNKLDPPSLSRAMLALSRLDLITAVSDSDREALLSLAQLNIPIADQHSLVCFAYALCTLGWNAGIEFMVDILRRAAAPRIFEKPTFAPQLAVAMQVVGALSDLTLQQLRAFTWLWDESTGIAQSGDGLDPLRLSVVQEEVTRSVSALLSATDKKATIQREASVNAIWTCDLLLLNNSHVK